MSLLTKIQKGIIDRIEVENGSLVPQPKYQSQIERYCRGWKNTIDMRIGANKYSEAEATHKMLPVYELMRTLRNVDSLSKLRKKLLNWHYNKSRTVGIIDLLDSSYQSFRYRVAHRLCNDRLDFREAIKQATEDELNDLRNIIDEDRLGI